MLVPLGLYPALEAPRLEAAPQALGAAAAVLLAAGLAGWSPGVAFSLALLGGEYTVMLILAHRAVDGWAPLMAGGLILLAELAYWSLDVRIPMPDAPGTLLRRVAGLAAVTAGGVAAGVAVLGAATLSPGGGTLLELLGVAAAAGALLVVARLAGPLREVDSGGGPGSSG